jgi:hypothetical protein
MIAKREESGTWGRGQMVAGEKKEKKDPFYSMRIFRRGRLISSSVGSMVFCVCRKRLNGNAAKEQQQQQQQQQQQVCLSFIGDQRR